ncbi:4710_t:CDS:2, partial [Gigaspora margarita]
MGKILKLVAKNVGYCYGIEMVTNKDQLEKEIMEFFCGYIYKHPGGSKKFIINNKNEFPLLWEALNGKIKVLKQSGKVTKHHDPSSSDELRTIFNHEALSINTAKGIQLTKFSQKNDTGGIEGNLDSLVIPVPADPEGFMGPHKDGKWHLNAKLGQNSCSNFMKNICSEVGINIKDRDIVNHSGRTTPITHLFRERSLSMLINVVDLPESQDDDGVEDLINKDQDSKSDNDIFSDSQVPPKSSVYSEFRSPLKDSTKPNLPPHINATKKNPTLGGKRLLRSSHSGLQSVSNNEQ